MLLILEDLGKTGTVTKDYMLSREQYYLGGFFKNYSTLIVNNCSIAGTTRLWERVLCPSGEAARLPFRQRLNGNRPEGERVLCLNGYRPEGRGFKHKPESRSD
jgi:hypothetical protein